MLKRRLMILVISAGAVMMFSAMCNPRKPVAISESTEAPNLPGNNDNAGPEITEEPVLPGNDDIEPEVTEEPEPIVLPDPVFSWPNLDTPLPWVCETGDEVNDPAIHVLSVDFYEASLLGFDGDDLIIRIDLGAPANTTLDEDYLFTLRAEMQVGGESVHPNLKIEGRDGKVSKGLCTDTDCVSIQPGTEDQVYTDDQGYIWMKLPADSRQMAFYLMHVDEDGNLVICFDIGWFTVNLLTQ